VSRKAWAAFVVWMVFWLALVSWIEVRKRREPAPREEYVDVEALMDSARAIHYRARNLCYSIALELGRSPVEECDGQYR
jgi:hypothetical protein